MKFLLLFPNHRLSLQYQAHSLHFLNQLFFVVHLQLISCLISNSSFLFLILIEVLLIHLQPYLIYHGKIDLFLFLKLFFQFLIELFFYLFHLRHPVLNLSQFFFGSPLHLSNQLLCLVKTCHLYILMINVQMLIGPCQKLLFHGIIHIFL